MDFEGSALARGRFSWQRAQTLAHISQLTYESHEAERHAWVAAQGLTFEPIESDETQGMIVGNDQALVIGLRGSEQINDWLVNAQFIQHPFPTLGGGAEAHGGFVDQSALIDTQIETALANAGDRAVWFTGHSLGGALALLAAVKHLGTQPGGLVTFGQPRVFNDLASGLCDRLLGFRYQRMMYGRDIVARIPPSLGYRHAGDLLRFNRRFEVIDGLGNGLTGNAKAAVEAALAGRSSTRREEAPPGLAALLEDNDGGLEEMSADAFEDLRMIARRSLELADELKGLPGLELRGVEEGAIGGLFEQLYPPAKDHRMANYIECCRRMVALEAV